MTQTLQKSSLLERRGDTTLYHVWDGYRTVKMTWKQMSNQQRLLQIEAERRAAFEIEFGIYQ